MAEADIQGADAAEGSWPGFIEIEMPDVQVLIGPKEHAAQIEQVISDDPSGYNRRRILGKIGICS